MVKVMKVCLITEYFFPEDSGGTPTVLSQLMRYMKDRYNDFEIDIVTSNNLYRRAGGKLAPYEDWTGISIYRVNSPRSNQTSTAIRLLAGSIFSVKAFIKLFSSRQYDLIIVGSNPPSAPFVGHWLSKRFNIPYCYLVHDLYPDIAVALGALRKNSKITQFTKMYQRKWLCDARKIMVLGRCMRDHLISEYQLPEERIKVITSWCDPNDIIPLSKDTEFRLKHGLTGFLVVYAGNIGRSQGLDTVLDAAKHLRASLRAIQFALVGKGDAWDKLSARIADEGLTNVHLLPAVPPCKYPEVLASADVSLVSLDPSLEGLAVPSKSYNILSSGRPLIALMSEKCEVARMVVEYNCGIQVDHGNSQQLVEVLLNLSKNPLSGIQMGRNARIALEEHFTIEHIAGQFYDLFQDIAQQQQTSLTI